MGIRSRKRLFSRAVPADRPTPSSKVCWIINISTAGIRKLAKPFCGLKMEISSYAMGDVLTSSCRMVVLSERSIFIHHREACMMIYVFTSVPLLFISGISWPGTAIPKFWEVISWLFPSTFGINGFVRINNMGATLTDVLTEYRILWIQTGVYFLTTCIVYRRQITLSRRHVYERLKEIKKRRKTNIV